MTLLTSILIDRWNIASISLSGLMLTIQENPISALITFLIPTLFLALKHYWDYRKKRAEALHQEAETKKLNLEIKNIEHEKDAKTIDVE